MGNTLQLVEKEKTFFKVNTDGINSVEDIKSILKAMDLTFHRYDKNEEQFQDLLSKNLLVVTSSVKELHCP